MRFPSLFSGEIWPGQGSVRTGPGPVWPAILLLCGCQLFGTSRQNPGHDWGSIGSATRPSTSIESSDVESVGYAVDPQIPDDPALIDPPDAPPLAETEPADGDMPLTLGEATQRALLNNQHLQVVRFIPEAAQTQIDTELATFDPVLQAGGQWNQANQQVQSAIQAAGINGGTLQTTSFLGPNGRPNQLELQKKWSTGTITRMGYGTNYNFNSPAGQFLVVNPAYQSALNFTVEQPLFQGIGRTANMLGVRIAETNHRQSLDSLQREINDTLLAVHEAYWTAFQAQADIANMEEIVREAELTWRKEARRAEIGDGSVLEAAQALENLETLRVELEKARKRATDSENRLRHLMGVSREDRQPLFLTETPFEQSVAFNVEQAIGRALRQRPEIDAQRRAVQLAALERDRLEQALRPGLSAVAGYSLTGLSNGVGGSFSNLATGQFGNWTFGLNYRHVFGRRAEEAAVEQAELILGKERAALRELEGTVTHEVVEAHDSLEASYDVLGRQRIRLEAARLQFEMQKRSYESGGLPLDRYVRAVSSYVHARRDMQSALTDYNIALARWAYVLGSFAPAASSDPWPAGSHADAVATEHSLAQ